MAKYTNTLDWKIKSSVDMSGFQKFQSAISSIQLKLKEISTYTPSIGLSRGLNESLKDLDRFQRAVTSSYNSKLGMMDYGKMKKNVAALVGDVGKLNNLFSMTGTVGKRGFNTIVGEIGKLDTGLRNVSSVTDKIMNTIGNTVRWGIIASGFQSITNEIYRSVDYLKELDASLTNIMMVTDNSRKDMNEFAKQANEAAKAIGSTTTAMTDATLVFAQQGFSLKESQPLAELSTKLANASQQDTATTSDQITTLMNAYNLDFTNLQATLDSWAEIANVSAADVQEIASGFQKAASTANTVGVNTEQLAAQIATIESVTREAPENIGNGLKTIYARFSDIAMGETLDGNVNLGMVTGTLEKVGVNVLDASTGKMRDVGSIMEDLMKVWGNIDTTQKNAIATTLAGKYQLARFEALMNRSDLYENYKQSGEEAKGSGTLDMMNDKFVDSMQGKINKLQSSFEGLIGTFTDTDDFYGFLDGLASMVGFSDDLTKSLGGSSTALTALAAIFMKMSGKSIASGVGNFISNRQAGKLAKENAKNAPDLLRSMGFMGDMEMAKNNGVVDFVSGTLENYNVMSEEQKKAMNEQREHTVQVENRQIEATSNLESALLRLNSAYRMTGEEATIAFLEIDEQTGKARLNTELFFDKLAEDATLSGLDLQKVSERFENIDNELEKAKQALALYNDKLNESGKRDSFAPFSRRLKEIVSSLKLSQEETDKLMDGINKIGRSRSVITTKEAMVELEKVINRIQSSLREQGGFANDPRALQTLIQEFNMANFAVDENRQKNRSILDSLEIQSATQSITSVASGIGSLAFAWQSFQSLGSIWTNSDLDGGEKLLQIIITTSMAIPMLITGFKDAVTGTKQFGESISKLALSKIALTTANEAETASMVANEAAQAASSASTAENTVQTTANTGARWGNVAATRALEAATRSAIASTGVGLLVMVAITAAIAAVTAGVKFLIDEYNKASNAAKDSAENAQMLADNYNHLKESQDELNTTLNDYDEAKKSLDEMTQGTDEWNSKLKETNDLVIDLLDKYPQLAKYVSRDSNGLLTIDTNGLDKFKEEQSKQITEANIATSMAKIDANQKQATSNKVDVSRQVSYFSPGAGMYGGAVPLNLTTSQVDKLYEAIAQQGEQVIYNKDEVAKILGANATDPIVTAVTNAASTIVNGYAEYHKNDEANKVLAGEAARNMLQLQGNFDFSQDNANEIIDAVAAAASENGQYYAQAMEGMSGKSNNDILSEYIKAVGGSNGSFDWLSSNAKFTDSNGTEQTVSLDEMKQYLASVQAMSDAADNWTSIADTVNSIIGNVSQYSIGYDNLTSSGMKNGEAFDFSNMTSGQINELGSLASSGNENVYFELFKGLSADEANQWAKNAGYESADAYVEAFIANVKAGLEKENAFGDIMAEKDKYRYNGTTPDLSQDVYYTNEDGNNVKAKGLNSEEEKIAIRTQMNNEDYQSNRDSIIDAVKDTNDLNKAYQEGLLLQTDYNSGLVKLAKSYGGLEEESSAVRKAQKKYESVINDTTSTEQDMKDATDELTKAQEDLEAAIVRKQWEKAAKSCEKYLNALEDSTKSSEEQEKAAQRLAETLSDVSGVEVSSDFVKNNLPMIEDWINGVEGAGSKLRVALGQQTQEFSDYATQIAAQTGVSVTDITNLLNGLSFDINGNADFTSIIQGLGMLDENFQLTEDSAQLLANILASIGNTNLQFITDSGEIINVSPDDLKSEDPSVRLAALKNLQQALKNWDASWDITGFVPSSGKESMAKVGSSSSSSSSGGSSGGSSKSFTPKKQDPLKDEIDRYAIINSKLDTTSNELDRLADAQERLTGQNLTNNLLEQINLLNKQIELQKEKLSIQQQEKEELQSELAGYGITFDKEGFIQNYEEIHNYLLKNVNDLREQISNASTQEASDALEEQAQAAEETLNEFKDAFERYNDLIANDIKDTVSELDNLKRKIEDIQINVFKEQIEATDSIKDLMEKTGDLLGLFSGLSKDNPLRDITKSAYLLSGYFEDASSSAESFYDSVLSNEGLLPETRAFFEQGKSRVLDIKANGGSTSLIDDNIANWKILLDQEKQMQETGTSTIFGTNAAALQEVKEQLFNQSYDLITSLEDAYEDYKDNVLGLLDNWQDDLDKILSGYQAITDELDHQQSIVEMLHGDKSFEEMDAILTKKQDVFASQIQLYMGYTDSQGNFVKGIIQTLQEQLATLEQGSDEYEAVKEKLIEAQSQLNDLTEQSLEAIQEKYTNAVNKVLEAWVTTPFGKGSDLDWVSEQWELINRNADQYLDEVNRAYNIQKLQGKYLELLDGSNDLAIQTQISDQMKQQLEYLRDKTKLSQYDVDYANAQLEILQKRIALEEAQRNKSQMKLRRNSQGDYTYVYTANQDNVNSAQSDLLDAENNAYNLSKDQMKQVQADSLSALSDAYSSLQNIWTNANLTLEEKEKRAEEIINSLKEYLGGTAEQLSTSEQNIVNDFLSLVELLSDENKNQLQDTVDQLKNGNTDAFNDIDARFGSSLALWLENLDNFKLDTDKAFDELKKNAESYQSSINEVSKQVKQNFNDMTESTAGLNESFTKLGDSAQRFIDTLADKAGIFTGAINQMHEYQDQLLDISNRYSDANINLQKVSSELISEKKNTERLENILASKGYNPDGSKIDTGGGTGGDGSGGSGEKDTYGRYITGFSGKYYNDSWGKAPTGNIFSGQAGAVRISTFSASPYGDNSLKYYGSYSVHLENPNGGALGWVRPDQLFDTGGYTGSWSDGDQFAKNGKLAWLHQKELILNEEDTLNILKAVKSVRAMTEQLKSGAFDAVISKIQENGQSLMSDGNGQTIQQEVHITADFPNVRDGREIEEALLSLNDVAAQYVYRNI